jgi:hypothetical protein
MKTTHRLLSMACAALLTLSMLMGIDQLAQTEPAQGPMAAAAAPRA